MTFRSLSAVESTWWTDLHRLNLYSKYLIRKRSKKNFFDSKSSNFIFLSNLMGFSICGTNLLYKLWTNIFIAGSSLQTLHCRLLIADSSLQRLFAERILWSSHVFWHCSLYVCYKLSYIFWVDWHHRWCVIQIHRSEWVIAEQSLFNSVLRTQFLSYMISSFWSVIQMPYYC